MMRYRILAVLLSAGLVVTLGPPSLADRTPLSDPDDAYGPLDVKRISHDHGAGRGILIHQLSTFGRWGRRTLRSDDSVIHLLFTTDGDNKPERVLVIDAADNGVRAEMREWRRGAPGDKSFGRAALKRTGPRTAQVRFRKSLLGRGVREYGWHVDTRFSDRDHGRCSTREDLITVCPDSAPDGNAPRAYLRHTL